MIVTSFSQKGYHEYGKTFIETFLKHWADETLVVFYESGIPSSAPKDDRVKYVNLFDSDIFRSIAKAMKGSDPLISGTMRSMKDPQEASYNFRFDANRFFRKVVSIYLTSTQHNKTDRYLAWLDADIVFHADIPQNFIADTLKNKYLAYLGRPGLFSECGYMAFDTESDQHPIFMQQYLDMYATGAFTYLGEYTDCYVFDTIRTLQQVTSNNLAKGIQSYHPFVYTVLGKYMDHLKGPERKKLRHSPEIKAIEHNVA